MANHSVPPTAITATHPNELASVKQAELKRQEESAIEKMTGYYPDITPVKVTEYLNGQSPGTYIISRDPSSGRFHCACVLLGGHYQVQPFSYNASKRAWENAGTISMESVEEVMSHVLDDQVGIPVMADSLAAKLTGSLPAGPSYVLYSSEESHKISIIYRREGSDEVITAPIRFDFITGKWHNGGTATENRLEDLIATKLGVSFESGIRVV